MFLDKIYEDILTTLLDIPIKFYVYFMEWFVD